VSASNSELTEEDVVCTEVGEARELEETGLEVDNSIAFLT